MLKLNPKAMASRPPFRHEIADPPFAKCALLVRRPSFEDHAIDTHDGSHARGVRRLGMVCGWEGDGTPSPFADDDGKPIPFSSAAFRAAVEAYPVLAVEASIAVTRAFAESGVGEALEKKSEPPPPG